MTSTVPAPLPTIEWAPTPGAHYLKPAKTSRVPRRYVFFDTEAYRDHLPAGEEQRWRCGVTACVRWREDSRTWSPTVTERHETPEDLWGHITGFAKRDARTVVVAHNLSYDLRISRAFEVLPSLGWEMRKLALSGEHIAFDMVKEGKTLALVDSLTVIPKALATIGEWKGEPKLPLPAEDDELDAWWDRCETDVRLLAWGYMEVVKWLSEHDLGGWARTGSGMAWHVMLRGHCHEKVLSHNQPELLETERLSCYAGRAEAWQVGKLTDGPFTVWDYENAYANVCASEPLPARYLGTSRGASVGDMVARADRFSYLVNAGVATDVPVLPWRDGKGVCWPVGTFTGWYWAWELAQAQENGAKVRVISAHRYAASRWLGGWAEWVLSQVSAQETPEARVRACVAKHWGRALVGRSAMRYKDWGYRGDAYVPGVSYWPCRDIDSGATGAVLQLGLDRWEAWEEKWWDSALPQLLSAVMAHSRVRLWDAMVCSGLDHVVHVDTDCVITDPVGSERLRRATHAGALSGLRVKHVAADIEPRAPQLIEGSTWRRLAGVPRRSVRVGDTAYEGERWEGVLSALAGGNSGVVKIAPLRQKLKLDDWRRRHVGGRLTAPYVVVDDVRQVDEGGGA